MSSGSSVDRIVWVQKIGAGGKVVDKVKLPGNSDVADLREAVKLKFAPMLDAFAAAQLVVKDSSENTVEEDALLSSVLEDGYGESKAKATRIEVPEISKQESAGNICCCCCWISLS